MVNELYTQYLSKLEIFYNLVTELCIYIGKFILETILYQGYDTSLFFHRCVSSDFYFLPNVSVCYQLVTRTSKIP